MMETTQPKSAEKCFAPFNPCLEPWAMSLEFGNADVLKVSEAINFAIGRDASKDAM
jgi:hypothetical protein